MNHAAKGQSRDERTSERSSLIEGNICLPDLRIGPRTACNRARRSHRAANHAPHEGSRQRETLVKNRCVFFEVAKRHFLPHSLKPSSPPFTPTSAQDVGQLRSAAIPKSARNLARVCLARRADMITTGLYENVRARRGAGEMALFYLSGTASHVCSVVGSHSIDV